MRGKPQIDLKINIETSNTSCSTTNLIRRHLRLPQSYVVTQTRIHIIIFEFICDVKFSVFYCCL